MYADIESYLLLLNGRTPSPAICGLGTVGAFCSPRSAGVRSSTEPEMTFHRTSMPARRPCQMGVAAVNANMTGESVANWSYRYRDSSASLPWNVTCKQQQPMPYAMQSMWMSPGAVFSSWKMGTRMSTLLPRLQRMFPVRAPKRGCGLMQASGTVLDSEAGPPGGAEGRTKSSQPISGKLTNVGAISLDLRTHNNRALRKRMLSSTCSRLRV
mmetsp:Transcript_97896/g.281646  ORF Transcript_97896/g.281646 Transcript_97896/m.281646 type:complete len:212 (+) Transcript_97896:1259-1894(+)